MNRYQIKHQPSEEAPDRPWVIFDSFEEVEVARYQTEQHAISRRKLLCSGIIAIILAFLSNPAKAGDHGRQGEPRGGDTGGAGGARGGGLNDDVSDPGHPIP